MPEGGREIAQGVIELVLFQIDATPIVQAREIVGIESDRLVEIRKGVVEVSPVEIGESAAALGGAEIGPRSPAARDDGAAAPDGLVVARPSGEAHLLQLLVCLRAGRRHERTADGDSQDPGEGLVEAHGRNLVEREAVFRGRTMPRIGDTQ